MAKTVLDLMELSKFGAFPTPAEGKYVGCVHFGDRSFLWRWDEVSPAGYETYFEAWQTAGATLLHGYRLGDNRYALMELNGSTVYLSYSAAPGILRLYAEDAGASVAPDWEMGDYTPLVGDCGSILWQLPTDVKTTAQNGGMSYVLRVADGSFFIIDGGYGTDVEADNLLAFLKEKSSAVGIEKPVVAGWFFSHLHGDHIGCFQNLARRHASEIDLKALYYNFPADHRCGPQNYGTRIETAFEELLGAWEDVKVYRKLHTGMQFYIADVRVDVLFTHEDLYPATTDNYNDTSTVIRLTAAGQKVLFPGDIMEPGSRVMERDIPAADMRADIVEFSHHGYEGATKEFYDLVAAPTVLWPMNIYGWQRPDPSGVFANWKRKTGSRLQAMPNAYICEEAPYVKKIIAEGEEVEELRLPYSPIGDKLPDYEAIHDRIAAKVAAEQAAKEQA